MTIHQLEELIAEPLRRLHWKLALAESCTGGLISHRVTNVAGSSEYYVGGVNAYSNEVKQNVLGVSPEIISQYGAVSEQTVRAMAYGVQNLLHSDVALSVSGIAGPAGGTPQKPVGTVWIGLMVKSEIKAACFYFSGDRIAIKHQSAETALWMLYQALQSSINSISMLPLYYEPVAVQYSRTSSSPLRIESFQWKNKQWKIESMGRQWSDNEGQHFLVMDFRRQVYELLLTSNGCWYLHPPHAIPAV